MKQILTTVVLLSLIATTAQAVPVALQRSGDYSSGDDPNGQWTLTLFFDSDDILDNQLSFPEVDNITVTTTAGNIIPITNFQKSELITSVILIDFESGSPITDNSVLFFDHGDGTFFYLPGSIATEQFELTTNDFANRVTSHATNQLPNDIRGYTGPGGWWEFLTLNTTAVPEPVTTTLLLAGTLAMTRRRRVA